MKDMEKFFIDVRDRRICAALHRTKRPAQGCVVTCHGLFSSKDTDKFLMIAERFTAAGLMVVRFDFSGCGESSGDISETTVSRRLEELEEVVRWLRQQGDTPNAVCLLGSSLGGYVASLYAARHPVAALSLWATPIDLLAIVPNIPRQELEKLRQDFYLDARAWDLAASLGALARVQIIHGTQDAIVPPEHAEKIHEKVNHPKELLFLDGADHSLTGDAHREEAASKSLAWFLQFL